MSPRRLARDPGSRLPVVLFLLGLAAVAVAIGARMLSQHDLPWHLAHGRQLVADRAIPTVDSFSFVGSHLHYLSVVSDLVLYGLAWAGGPLALQVFGAALAVLLAVLLCAGAREHGVAGLGLAALGLFAMNPWLTVRPATLSFLFCAAMLALVERHRAQPTTRRGRRALILALLVIPLWANCHAGAIVGVAILPLYAAHRTLATWWSPRATGLLPASDRGALVLPWIVAALAPLLVLVNPAGVHYLAGVALVKPYVALISEWTPTSLDYFFHVLPATGGFFVLAAAILLFGREPSGARVPPLHLLVLVVAAFSLITVKRFVPLAIVILVPILARRLGRLCADTARARALFASTLGLAGLSIFCLEPGSHGVGWEPRSFPEAAVRFVEGADLQGRMWNFWPYGGYLIWRLYPAHQVALDGRFGLVAYEPDYVLEVVASEREAAPFAALVARYDLQWAFCFATTAASRSCEPVARDPAWTMIYLDDLAAIYVKRAGPNRAQAELGYRWLRHLTPPRTVLDRVLHGQDLAALSHDGALARAQAPTSTRALFLDAVGALAVDDGPRFLDALQTLGELAPDDPALPLLARLVPRLHGAARPAPAR